MKLRKLSIYIVGICAVAITFLWPLVLNPNHIPMPRLHQNTDMLVTHLPVARYIHAVIQEHQRIPLWNSAQFSGQPFAADPLAGYWYIPNWLTFIWPQPMAFNVLFGLHYLWAGLGLFFLMKSLKVRSSLALFSAIVFMGTPKLAAYIGSGQVTIVFAVCWTPWLLFIIRKAMPFGGYNYGILSGAFLATIILADIRWGFYAGILSLAYAVSRVSWIKAGLAGAIKYFSSLIISTAILTAGLLIPFFEFISYSRRSGMAISNSLIYGITPELLINLIIPQYGIIWEHVLYIGIIPILLFFLTIRSTNNFWRMAAIISFIGSLGLSVVILSPLSKIFPFVSLMRVPSRAWFLFALMLAIIAGLGLEEIFKFQESKGEKEKEKRLLFLFAFGVLSILFSLGLSILLKYIEPGVMQLAVVGPISAIILGLIISKRITQKPGVSFLIIVVLFDLLSVNTSYLTHTPLPEESQAVKWISSQEGLFRVYSPSYSLPMPHQLQQVNGVNPMHLNYYANYLSTAANIDGGEYSVSVPDIYIDENTTKEMRELAANPNPFLLGLLNVKYLVAEFPLKPNGLVLMKQFDSTFIYENEFFQNRVWMEQGQARILLWSPDKIVVKTTGAGGQLVLSEIVYPGWQVSVDGVHKPIERYGIFRAVTVGEGEHFIIFSFNPLSVYLPAGLSLIAWLILLIKLIFLSHKNWIISSLGQ